MDSPLRITVVCGTGAHADRWHDLPATTASLASALATSTRAAVASARLDELPRLGSPDLLVLNVSGDLDAPPADSRSVVDELLRRLHAGVPVLAVHSAAYAFRDDARWAQTLGGRWVVGSSGHPPIGPATITLDHPIVGETELTTFDERYTDLEVLPGSTVVATHTEGDSTHPLVWVREDGPARVAYSALGHDPRSYASTGHRMLLSRLVAWLTEPRD